MGDTLLIEVIKGVFFAGAFFASLRAEFKNLHQQIDAVRESVNDAHRRLDIHLDKGK